MYEIKEYTKKKAKEYNVKIKPSTNKNKKIDVFNQDNQKIASIGAIKYDDYPTHILKKGIDYANERRRLYKIRHKKDLNSKNGFWAQALLW
jgi:hypothetical protein